MDATRQHATVSLIQHKFTSLPTLSDECCIYRVPEKLRKVNEDAYRPLLVSISPFYFDDLKHSSTHNAMQDQKLRNLRSFIGRNKAHTLETYVDVIRARESDVRNCYAETIYLGSEHFIEMVLIDSAFVIELFLRFHFLDDFKHDQNDSIFNKARMIGEVADDIVREENQLPFFILEKLYELLQVSFPIQYPSFKNLTYKFLANCGSFDLVTQPNTTTNIKHFVDFLRLCHHLPSSHRIYDTPSVRCSGKPVVPNHIGRDHSIIPPTVTELSEARVKFVLANEDRGRLFNIRFHKHKGILKISKFVVVDSTDRNIMVFEQCHYYSNSCITDYFVMLGGLINSGKDVEMRVRNSIIENLLGSNEEVANLINMLGKNTGIPGCINNYYKVGLELREYTKTRWHIWKAILKRNYFGHPWAIISVIYAFVILILTVLQVATGFTSKM